MDKQIYGFFSNGKLIHKEVIKYYTTDELFIKLFDLRKKLNKQYPNKLILARIIKD